MDQELLGSIQRMLADEVGWKEEEFTKLSNVNPRSPKQLAALLYEDLKFPKQYHRKTKKITTDEEAIEKLRKKVKHPIFSALLGYRDAMKRLEIATPVLGKDGRLRTKYSQTITGTGRLSSRQTDAGEGGNLQNEPPWFRAVIVADPGKVLVEVDKSQAEARIVAWLAQDEEMMGVFNDSSRNIHRFNASRLFGLKEEEVVKDSSPEQPYGKAKRCVHAMNYKLGYLHGAEIAGVSVAEFKKVQAEYLRKFSRIVEWWEEIKEVMEGDRVLINSFGRRRQFLGRPGDDMWRKMIAFLPQSTCVDDVLIGMVCRLQPVMEEGEEFLLQTHDGFVAQCPKEGMEGFKERIVKAMVVPFQVKGRELKIPVEIKVGERWGEVR